jgi:glycosyltransferase involved in cell wall biosynthesis
VLPERIFVAAHAMDNASYRRPVSQNEIDSLRARLGLNPTQKVILYMGRLVPEKGLVYLIEAFAALKRKDVVLVLAGEGSERSTLERLVQEREIGRSVLFAGYVPPEQALCFYALSWVFILPSITTQLFKEPWGQVVNEAMNQGVPVIATDAVGAVAGGLVQDGINGFVVPERDSKSLAASMIRILDDAELRHRFGQNAKQTIASWTNERMVLGFRQAIDYVLKHHGSVE